MESKQKYLCTEIMEKGYDPDDFTRWIDQDKKKRRPVLLGCDLEKWTMEEIHALVKEYQDSHLQFICPENTTAKSSERNSPSEVSDKLEYSSIHSRSIPVSHTTDKGNIFSTGNRRRKKKRCRCSHLRQGV